MRYFFQTIYMKIISLIRKKQEQNNSETVKGLDLAAKSGGISAYGKN